jgi:SAM-dependent methyltransferase
MFADLQWRVDGMVLRGLDFKFDQGGAGQGLGSADHFVFLKDKGMIDLYARFFAARPDFRPRTIFELGIYDGGSTAMWFELLQPDRHLAIDFQGRRDSAYFDRWVASQGLGDRVTTHWRTDQADKAELRRLADRHLEGAIDLVIDDASHLYGPSKASFETLFPLLPPGGIYIIEDWAWDHWPGFDAPDHPWARERRLTDLIIQLTEVAGAGSDLIARIEIYQGFVAIERGPRVLAPRQAFQLEDQIQTRGAVEVSTAPTFAPPSPLSRLKRWLRRKIG